MKQAFTFLCLIGFLGCINSCNTGGSGGSERSGEDDLSVPAGQTGQDDQWQTRGGENYGIFAPDDAWLDGDSLPYYGSENEWSRRMFEEAPADRFYKRRGQRQLLAILDGKPELAVEYCERRLEQDPSDPEVYFMLTLAYASIAGDAKTGKRKWLVKAEESMQKALDLGMPFGRFIAGPRQLMAPVSKRPLYRQLYAEASPLVHGPMLGNSTSGSISCWVRTAEESPVIMIAWKVQGPADTLRSTSIMTREEDDYSGVMDLTGLEPGTGYRYNILIDGKPVFGDAECPSFTSGKSGDEADLFRLAFGGCAGYTPGAEKIWNLILRQDPDALFLLGDNVYVDLPGMPGPFHDYTYYRRYSRPEYRSLVSRVPVYSIWDDHDAAIDDIWMGPYVDQPEWKLPMVRHFQRLWVNPGYGTVEWPGCWYSFKQADIEFFMLDGRTYRTCPFGPEPTMLGPVQKSWLLEGLANSTASVKVLVSPVAWTDKAKPGSHDTWAGFPEERDEIFNLIIEKEINGVMLMSADRHRSEIWQVDWEGPYPLYEFLSSRLTNMHFHEIEAGAIFSYNDPQSFGILDFNTKVKVPTASLQYINIEGEIVFDRTFQIGN
ncbi:MAG: alkaline phosphatase D family protein [Bacteroidales bacterium]